MTGVLSRNLHTETQHVTMEVQSKMTQVEDQESQGLTGAPRSCERQGNSFL